MNEKVPEILISTEDFLADLQRHEAMSDRKVYSLPHSLIGATVLARSLSGEPIIDRGVWSDHSYDLPGYFTDGKKPRIDVASGMIGSPFLFAPDYILTLFAQEGRFLFKRDIQYFVPLLRNGDPAVELTVLNA